MVIDEENGFSIILEKWLRSEFRFGSHLHQFPENRKLEVFQELDPDPLELNKEMIARSKPKFEKEKDIINTSELVARFHALFWYH